MENMSDFDLFTSMKIGEGKFREVFSFGDLAIKTLKPHFTKKYGRFNVNMPTGLYTKYKFGIKDFNEHEFAVYRDFIDRVPEVFRDSFYQIYSILHNEGKSYLLTQLIKDDDGQISRTMSQTGHIQDTSFWKRFDQLEDILVEQDIALMAINSANIVVQRSGNNTIPVFTDYKRFGNRTYPAQFWLASRSQRAKKIQRNLQTLRDKHNE